MQKAHELRIWSPGQADPLEGQWWPIPVFLPGKLHEQKSLVAYSPWGPEAWMQIAQQSTNASNVCKHSGPELQVCKETPEKAWPLVRD